MTIKLKDSAKFLAKVFINFYLAYIATLDCTGKITILRLALSFEFSVWVWVIENKFQQFVIPGDVKYSTTALDFALDLREGLNFSL